MSEPSTIASILDEHYPLRRDDYDPDLVWWRCGCGEPVDYSPNLDRETAEECHQRHLTEILEAAASEQAEQQAEQQTEQQADPAASQVSDLLATLNSIDAMWGDPDEARRLLRKALAKAGMRPGTSRPR